jgi:hypothetical protein
MDWRSALAASPARFALYHDLCVGFSPGDTSLSVASERKVLAEGSINSLTAVGSAVAAICSAAVALVAIRSNERNTVRTLDAERRLRADDRLWERRHEVYLELLSWLRTAARAEDLSTSASNGLPLDLNDRLTAFASPDVRRLSLVLSELANTIRDSKIPDPLEEDKLTENEARAFVALYTYHRRALRTTVRRELLAPESLGSSEPVSIWRDDGWTLSTGDTEWHLRDDGAFFELISGEFVDRGLRTPSAPRARPSAP